MPKTIAILSDFGYKDNYTGIMKGVIKTICPFADVIDLNNGINLGDIKGAAYQLESSFKYFPDNTIFLCVVDPGVGSSRKAVAIQTDKYFFVAPDNGLLTSIILNENIKFSIELNNPKYHNNVVSNTFHGRDIFAPAAAYLANRIDITELGMPLPKEDLVTLDETLFKRENEIHGEIIYNDNFGNLITNIRNEDLVKKKDLKILVAEFEINRIHDTYSNVDDNELFAYIGSAGRLEIGISNGSAHKFLNFAKSITVKILYN